MFHRTNFGGFGVGLPSDRRGFVPETGEALAAFDFGGEMEEEEWVDFVEAAVEATAEAVAALRDWREENQ